MNRNDRETQLAPYNAGYAANQLAPWEQGMQGGAMSAAPAQPPATPLRKMHRLLRGRDPPTADPCRSSP